MEIPSRIPTNKRGLLEDVVTRLARVAGMRAIVLGGSYAGGTQHRGSDLDLGLYYLDSDPFSIAAVREVAEIIAVSSRPPTVTGFYEWGAWVNGGAWIETRAGKVDFLYRSLDQVRRTIAESIAGVTRRDYDQQPANGYYSVGYLAETQICLPLYDPAGEIATLKQSIREYPLALKNKIVADSLWSAEFTLIHARGFAARGDVYSTASCLTRASAHLTQVLFALNETYFLGDKTAMRQMASFRILPSDFICNLQEILGHTGSSAAELEAAVTRLDRAWHSVKELAGDMYAPKFKL